MRPEENGDGSVETDAMAEELAAVNKVPLNK